MKPKPMQLFAILGTLLLPLQNSINASNYQPLDSTPKTYGSLEEPEAERLFNMGMNELFYPYPGSYEKAVLLLTQAAQKGHAKAQLHLAMLYEQGIGTKKDFIKAAEFYSEALANKNTNDHDSEKASEGLKRMIKKHS